MISCRLMLPIHGDFHPRVNLRNQTWTCWVHCKVQRGAFSLNCDSLRSSQPSFCPSLHLRFDSVQQESQRCSTPSTRYLNLPYLSTNHPIVRPLSARTHSLALISACLDKKGSVGGMARTALVRALAKEPGASMQCTHYHSEVPMEKRNFVPGDKLIWTYEHSRFCLVPPGERWSSISDTFVACACRAALTVPSLL